MPRALNALSVDPFKCVLPHGKILSVTTSVDLIWPWILIQSPDQARSFPFSFCQGVTDFCLLLPLPLSRPLCPSADC